MLKLKRDATPAEVKKLLSQVLKYHPDKNWDDPSASDKFRAVSEAYEVLSDEK